jgi:hypothetical protein
MLTLCVESTMTVTESDVLCGRGGLSHQHPGNRMFRRLVNENKHIYQKCDNSAHKHLLTVSVVSSIRRLGGRFLRKQGAIWKKASHKEACLKTSQALREHDASGDETSSSSCSFSKAKEALSKQSKAKDKSPRPSTGPVSRRDSDSNTEEERPMRLISDYKSLNREGPIPAIMEYELGEFLCELLSDDDSAVWAKEMLSPHDAHMPCNQEKKDVAKSAKETSLPLTALGEDKPDLLCPLGLDDFLFESSSEYEDLCRGLAESLTGTAKPVSSGTCTYDTEEGYIGQHTLRENCMQTFIDVTV